MTVVTADFDGRVFVPRIALNLPVGTLVKVVVPGQPQPPSKEDVVEWEGLLSEIRASEPKFPTVDEALRQSRARP